MKKAPLSRRDLLRLTSLGLGLLPFIPLLESTSAEAAGTDLNYPKRLILFFTPHGTFKPRWIPTGTERNFTLNSVLSPLESLKSKIVVLHGVGMQNPAYFAGHTPGGVQLWTGSDQARGALNTDGSYQYGPNLGPSIDQVIANQFKGRTSYDSLQFYSGIGGGSVIYKAPGQSVEPEHNPIAAFNRLFGSSPSIAARTNDTRISVLDSVLADIASMNAKVSTNDKAKIDAHLQGVRDLEVRLKKQYAACGGPTLGTDTTSMGGGWQSMMKNITSALSCDLTRVVSMQFGQVDNDGFPYPFLGVTADHHSLTHMAPSDTLDHNGAVAASFAGSVNGQLTTIYQWYTQQFAFLLNQLNSIPEGSGTMLDNTLVVWGTEIADFYTHNFVNSVPFVLAGGCGGALNTGRFLDYSSTPQKHNRLLVSIGQMMGLTNLQTFGTMDTDTGGLNRL